MKRKTAIMKVKNKDKMKTELTVHMAKFVEDFNQRLN